MPDAEYGKTNRFVKALVDGLDPSRRRLFRDIAIQHASPKPTGDDAKILMYQHALGLARRIRLDPPDPHVIAEKIMDGSIELF